MTDPIDPTLDPDDPGDLDAMLDRLLAGAPEPAPPWSGRVALLVRAAQAPPAADELVGEGDIVRRMGHLIAGSGQDDTRPDGVPTPAPLGVVDLARHRARDDDTDTVAPAHAAARRADGGLRGVTRGASRLIAAKAAAATTAAVLGVAAAAATTGIVVTMVVPAISDLARKPEPSGVSEQQPRTEPPGPGGATAEGPEGSGGTVLCPRPPGCDKSAAPGTAPGSSTSTTAADTSTTVAGEADATTSTSLGETTTTVGASTTSDTTGTTLPGRAGDAPGQGQGPPVTRGPGRPTSGP